MEMMHAEEFIPKRTLWQTLSSEKYFKWLLVSPLILSILIFMVYPTVTCLYYSLTEYIGGGKPDFVGLENYRHVLNDDNFWQALGRTFYVLVICIAVELCVGMGVAMLFNRDFRGQNYIRGMILLPLVISPMAVSMMWNFFLQYEFGAINLTLAAVGLAKVQWFSPKYALYTIAAISIWQWIPFSIFVLLAGLKGLPKHYFDAAKVDGATSWYIFKKLTLPALRPLILIIILLRTMWLIRLFEPLYGTTAGGVGTELLDWIVYRIAFVYFDIGGGSAMAVVSLFLTIIVCAILYRELMKALGVIKT
jgi:multiple sugar transport system permease protein